MSDKYIDAVLDSALPSITRAWKALYPQSGTLASCMNGVRTYDQALLLIGRLFLLQDRKRQQPLLVSMVADGRYSADEVMTLCNIVGKFWSDLAAANKASEDPFGDLQALYAAQELTHAAMQRMWQIYDRAIRLHPDLNKHTLRHPNIYFNVHLHLQAPARGNSRAVPIRTAGEAEWAIRMIYQLVTYSSFIYGADRSQKMDSLLSYAMYVRCSNPGLTLAEMRKALDAAERLSRQPWRADLVRSNGLIGPKQSRPHSHMRMPSVLQNLHVHHPSQSGTSRT